MERGKLVMCVISDGKNGKIIRKRQNILDFHTVKHGKTPKGYIYMVL